MNQLIPTFSGELAGEIQPLVNARDLHAVLGVRKDFSTWIKDRIEQYGFTEGEDYRSPNLGSGKNQGLSRFVPGHNRKDYDLSMDMAKELSMLEGNDQGRQARRYFIQMEKVARQEIPAFLRRGDLPRPGQVEALRLKRVAEALAGELLRAKPERRKLLRYRKMGLSVVEIGRLMRMGKETVRREISLMEACGLLEVTSKLEAQRAVAMANLTARGGSHEIH